MFVILLELVSYKRLKIFLIGTLVIDYVTLRVNASLQHLLSLEKSQGVLFYQTVIDK